MVLSAPVSLARQLECLSCHVTSRQAKECRRQTVLMQYTGSWQTDRQTDTFRHRTRARLYRATFIASRRYEWTAEDGERKPSVCPSVTLQLQYSSQPCRSVWPWHTSVVAYCDASPVQYRHTSQWGDFLVQLLTGCQSVGRWSVRVMLPIACRCFRFIRFSAAACPKLDLCHAMVARLGPHSETMNLCVVYGDV